MGASLAGTTVVVFGGSSGIGLATARMANAAGARVTIAGRDVERLGVAQQQIGDVDIASIDVADEFAVAEFLAAFERIDHVATFAGTHMAGNVTDVSTAALHGPVGSRFWGPVHICKHAAPRMTAGSITICTAAALERPATGRAIASAAAAGSETFGRSMAVELAPIRVNVVRPGLVDTPLLDAMAGEGKAAFVDAQASLLPVGRVGRPEDVASAVRFLMTNDYVTGATLCVDGGASLL